MWACRPERVQDPAIVAGAAALDRQRRRNAMRLDWIAAAAAPEHRWPVDLAREYLGRRMRYEVGAREREAVARFFGEAGLGEAVWGEPNSQRSTCATQQTVG
jgi:hypothetical protein